MFYRVELPAVQNDIWEKMVQKILHDPDKFERMFAVRYLSKYKYTEIKATLFKLLDDDDLEVVKFAAKILQEKGESF